MAVFRLYKKQWESGFRSSNSLVHPRLENKVADGPAGEAVAQPLRPSPPSFTRDGKRRHSESSELLEDDVDEVTEASSSSSRAHSPSPPNASHNQHISTLPKHRNQGRSQPPIQSAQRKGVSLGISTVTRRAGGIKEVRNKGTRAGNGGGTGSVAGNGSKGRKKTGNVGEMWWKSLGGGKKGSIKL